MRGLSVDVSDPVELMVSELVTNAVRHNDGDFVVFIDVTLDQIRVQVTDWGAGEPATRSPAPLEPSGRGLRIVEALSDNWGVGAAGAGGKSVWFTLGLRHSATG